jgi:hypothetical protein
VSLFTVWFFADRSRVPEHICYSILFIVSDRFVIVFLGLCRQSVGEISEIESAVLHSESSV